VCSFFLLDRGLALDFGWRIAQSYGTVRNLMQNIGYITPNEDGTFQCFDDYDVFDAIRCPEGYYRRVRAEVLSSCSQVGLPCPPGKECLCSPCRKADTVEILPVRTATLVTQAMDGEYNISDNKNCERMAFCTIVEQGEEVVFDIVDNRFAVRGAVEVTYALHDAGATLNAETEYGKATTLEPGRYQFSLQTTLRGSHVVEVFVDGKDTDNSPFIFAVKDKTCFNRLEVADPSGNCQCEDGASSFGGGCVKTSNLIAGIAVPVLALVILLALVYARIQQKKADSLWTIERREIFFDDPPETLGRGSFGLVLKVGTILCYPSPFGQAQVL